VEDLASEIASLGGEEESEETAPSVLPPAVLPFARRDLERLRLLIAAQRRLREVDAPASARQALAAKTYFEDALRWMEIHGGPEGQELAAHWRRLPPKKDDPVAESEAADTEPKAPPRKRRRRRRRRPGAPSSARA
jgi:poly(A) polymerase